VINKTADENYSMDLVGLKIFLLKPRLAIENDRKYITKE